jgi:tetratricopeptide (TPR) repeat protein
MKPRAFVVMPFGEKPVPVTEVPGEEADDTTLKTQARLVDFDEVWVRLIKPALEISGCEAFRADSEISAGDIRTDMFFELVTADFVIADISIPNPNVYYELGIRDGVCARGVFLIDGGWSSLRPFDVAQDRSFQYPGKLFEIGDENKNGGSSSDRSGETETSTAEEPDADTDPTKPVTSRSVAVRRLATVFQRAFTADLQGTGSPLYSHLPGLKPANWEQIDTSRARYFGSLESDWEARVRRAQELNRPGHILTIAQYAPTRLHRNKIMSTAGQALIGLNQFGPAEEVLEEVLQITPDDVDAQLSLAIAKINQNDILGAEHQLRKMLRIRQTAPKTEMVLGYVYRLLWYVQWKNEPNPQERAKESSRLLMEAIHCLASVQRRHPELYLSGYNTLLLVAVAKKLFGSALQLPKELVNHDVLTTVVRYMANAAKQLADETGDYDNQFWTSVAISGLDMLKGDADAAVQGVRDACAVPSATLFNLRWFEERLVFLQQLEFEPVTVGRALDIVKSALNTKQKGIGTPWKRVLVFRGYPIHKEDTSDTTKDKARMHFPRSIKEIVEVEIRSALDTWGIGEGDLAMCTTSTECDLYFGQQCLQRGAHLRVLVLEPTRTQLADEMRDPACGDWTAARSTLLSCAKDVWYHRDELGTAVDATSLTARHNRWLLDTARIEADHATAQESRLLGLVLSDRSLNVDDPEDPAFFVAEIRSLIRYKGIVKVIDLIGLAETGSAAKRTSAA